MKKITGALAVSLCTFLPRPLWAADLQSRVQSAFARIKVLKDMEPGRSYTLPIHGKPETGPKETFLRRRGSSEILASGLSCGCGDYAITFLQLMQSQGVQTRLIDGAEVSIASLATHFAGHAVVAVRQAGQHDWWLANPTDQTILSKHWAPSAQYFRAFGSCFWIGYSGSLASYPARDADALQRFYAATLAKVPRAFLNAHLTRLNFTVDDSLRDGKGGYRNPNLAQFLASEPKILNAYKIQPARHVSVRLFGGGDDARSFVERGAGGQWRAVIGLRSGCSLSLLDYFARQIGGA